MGQRGRPKNPEPSIRLAIAGWLNPEYDADILAWLEAIPKGQRMNALKLALRNGGLARDQADVNQKPEETQAAADSLLSYWEF